jgi:hypothetical protein
MLVSDTGASAVTYSARTLLGSRSRLLVGLAAGLLAVPCLPARAAKPRCPVGQAAARCAAGLGTGLLNAGQCQGATPSGTVPEPADTAADRLQTLIDAVPCPATGRVSFNTRDDHGDSMSVLDPLPSPGGGYLGVYHSEFRLPGEPAAIDFRISLARSTDLIHWTRALILDPTGASMPTLQPVPDGRGYLLAYEKRAVDGGGVVRVRYYPSLAALLAGRFAAEQDIPRTFSPYNEGTPTILSVHWNGGLRRSSIELGFHYESAPHGWRGPDREALGTLRKFRVWSARTDRSTDAALDEQGLDGSHGSWRQFGFDGDQWRVYEAQSAFDNFGTWRVILDSPSAQQMYLVHLTMGARPVSSSYANPVARVEPAPHGTARVLVVTMFLFAAARPGASGELVYYQPI